MPEVRAYRFVQDRALVEARSGLKPVVETASGKVRGQYPRAESASVSSQGALRQESGSRNHCRRPMAATTPPYLAMPLHKKRPPMSSHCSQAGCFQDQSA